MSDFGAPTGDFGRTAGQEWKRSDEIDQHSIDHAAQLLADKNYPTKFERGSLLYRQQDRHEWKQVSNLLAMLDEARAAITCTGDPQ